MPGSVSKKGAQRTKGNVKPSSSSRAAELLSSSGSAPTGFIGFGTLTGTPGYVPASESFDDIDSSLDADFRMVLRKFSKRDSTTKIKTLQEMSCLCQEKDDDSVKLILPYWPRIYNKMAIDVDHRVREATQQTMSVLVERVRRSLAPHLKAIMGCWLLSQCDTYPTVATAASRAFQTAFPPSKQQEAIVFCRQEATEYLIDNLVNQSPTTLTDPKTSTQEDMDSKYNRVVASSLLALRKLFLVLPSADQASIKGQICHLLQDGKFWKLTKSSIVSIKTGVYYFFASLCQVHPDIATEVSMKLAPHILHNIDNSDPVVCPALWEATLCAVSSVEECWKSINWSKAFWPKLRSLLQNGCHGNASTIGPNFLPLLSRIPSDLSGDPAMFFPELSNCFITGISKETVQQSVSECSALVTSFLECCQYATNQLLQTHKEREITQVLVMEYVLPLVQSSLLDGRSTLARSPLYCMVRQFMVKLDKMDEGHQVAEIFWKNLYQTIDSLLSEQDSHLECLSERLIVLVKGCVSSQTYGKSKEEKVRFALSDKGMSDNEAELTSLPELSDGCRTFLQSISTNIFRKAFTVRKDEFISVFCEIFQLYSNVETVSKLLDVANVPIQNQNVYLIFQHDVVVPWICKLQMSSGVHMQCYNHFLSVIFANLHMIDRQDGAATLMSLSESSVKPCYLASLMEKAITRKQHLACIRDWLKSSHLTSTIVSLAETVLSVDSDDVAYVEKVMDDGWTVISLVLSTYDSEVLVFDDSCIEGIIKTIQQVLVQLRASGTRHTADFIIHFVTKAALKFFQNLKLCLSVSSSEELMLALFTISVDGSYPLSEKSHAEVRSAWVSGLAALVKQMGALLHQDGFIVKACGVVRTWVEFKTNTIETYCHVCHTVQRMLTVLSDTLPDSSSASSTMQTVIQNLVVSLPPLTQYNNILDYMAISGQLMVPFLIQHTLKTVTSPSQLVFITLFNSQLLMFSKSGDMTLPSWGTAQTNVCVDEDESSLKCILSEWTSDDMHVFLSTLTGLVVIQLWSDIDKQICHEFSVEIGHLKGLTTSLVDSMPENVKQALLEFTLSRSLEHGCLESASLMAVLNVLIGDGSDMKLMESAIIDRCSTLNEASIHTLQCCVVHFSESGHLTVAEIMAARLNTSPIQSATELDGGLGPLTVLNLTLSKMSSPYMSEIKDILRSTLVQIRAWKKEIHDLMLFASELSDVSLRKIIPNIEVMKFVKLMVTMAAEELSALDWDFVMCSTVGWIQSMVESSSQLTTSVPVSAFGATACQLLAAVAQCLETEVASSSSFPPNLCTEWEEFFSEGAYTTLLTFYISLVGQLTPSPPSGLQSQLLMSVGYAVSYCPKQQILAHQLSPCLIAGDTSPLPSTLQSLMNHLCPLLVKSDRSVQVTAFLLINRIVGDLPLYEKEEKEDISDEAREDSFRSPPSGLMSVVDKAAVLMDVILADCTYEDCVKVNVGCEGYHAILGALLAWKLLLKFFKSSPSELRAQYAAHLKESGAVNHLLCHLLKLIPDNPVWKKLSGQTQNLFEMTKQISAFDKPDNCDIQFLACAVYRQCLETIPAMVRQWWIDHDRKTSSYIDRFTKKHVSPLLCASEIISVQTTDKELEGIMIKARPTTREVIATYVMAEVRIEVVISLPENYPLGSISVVSEKRVGVSQAQWDKWLLHLNIFLQHQNGTIIEGLKLWKKNIDKRFEGVDDCMICFSVLHGTTFKLPRLQCRTCKKKYHSACLYKWFSTSHNSTCPLCRNLF